MAISREQLQEYDEIELFNDTYIKVKKGNKFNLIDSDGNYLSTVWFDDIKKNIGGGVDVIVQNEKGQKQRRSYTDYHDIKKSDELTSLVRHTNFLSFIDVKDVIMVTPYKIAVPGKTNRITIIAQVNYQGEMLLIGKDGKLYNQDGTIYE